MSVKVRRHENTNRRPMLHGSGGGGGGKGGGGGGGWYSGGGAPSEAPDTLQSQATARGIDVISEGEIVGLVGGARGIYVDDVPLQNEDGTYNFEDYTWSERKGTPSQDFVPGFASVETEYQVGIEVTEDVSPIREISDSNVNAVRVTIRLPSLTYQSPSTGNLTGNDVEFVIEYMPSGGAWLPAILGRHWAKMESVTTTGPTASGLRVEVKDTTSSASPVAYDLYVQYRATGDVSWITLGRKQGSFSGYYKTVSRLETITRWSSGGEESTQEVVVYSQQFVDGEVYETFEVSGLASDEYEFQVVSGTLVEAFAHEPDSIKIKGKQTAEYERNYRVDLTGSAPWLVKVRNLKPDATTVNDRRQVFWARFSEIIDQKLYYPYSAYVAFGAPGKQFGGRVPRRAYLVDGIICQIPSNYDPYLRTYDGIWDGSFTTGWTNNPAWVLYDVLTNDRYGLGDYISAALIDKWELYDIGEYCDEFVDDGFGGVEPRFTINVVINSRAEAIKLVQLIASTFRGIAFWRGGVITASQDRPRDAVKIVTAANVLNGEFAYSGSDIDARHTVAFVTWNDPADLYRPAIEVVEDREGILRYGWRPTDVASFGCTSRGQAHRVGKWLLYTERMETETITYRCSWDQVTVVPGQIVNVADPWYAGIRRGGRLSSVTSTTQVSLDDPVSLSTGITYTLAIILPSGVLETQTITNGAGSHTDITVASAFSETPAANAIWAVAGSDVELRPFRIVGVREVSVGIFEYTGLFYDETKFAAIESDIVLQQPSFTALPTGPLAPVTSTGYEEFLFRSGSAVLSGVQFSWVIPGDGRIAFYEVQHKGPDAYNWSVAIATIIPSVDIKPTENGTWGFRVRPISGLGQKGAWYEVEIDLLGVLGPPSAPSAAYVDPPSIVRWVHDDAPIDLKGYMVRYLIGNVPPTWDSATSAHPSADVITTTEFNISSLPSGTLTIMVKSIDEFDVESEGYVYVVYAVGDQIVENLILTIDHEALGWPGTITGGAVDVDDVVATEETSVFWAADSSKFWNADDNSLFWGSNYLQMTYEFEYHPDAGTEIPSTITLSTEVTGDPYVIEWRTDPLTAFWSGSGSSLFWGDDADLFWDQPGSWQTWPGYIDAVDATIFWRITTGAGLTEGRIATLVISLDVPDIVEYLDDIAISSDGTTRLPLASSFRVIQHVQLTIQDDGGNAETARTFDKSLTGPLVRCYNSAGSLVDGTVDAIVQGY